MSIPTGYVRVAKSRPCPICGKPDYCLVHKDGGTALCPRTPSERQWGECGFYHVVDENARAARGPAIEKRPAPTLLINPETTIDRYERNLTLEQLNDLGSSLGVSVQSLGGLRVGWSHQHNAYTFPMQDRPGSVIGIRVRNTTGDKWAVTGSRNGLFIPSLTPEQFDAIDEWHIVEGPTDTAAALDMGLWTIGRPSCSAGVDMLCALMRGKKVYIVSNYDPAKQRMDGSEFHPGQDGAAVLADQMERVASWVSVIYPRRGAKDVREWIAKGGTREEIDMVKANAAAWTRRVA